ncbi:FecR family protein [Echinicola salinicaeni]|uniref:FecR family protein n=1 Tax=Echinicola salinicaeni TaxID=2762757 RepID=UPI00164653A6|nr:FecR family protein [Echinicola salinicaeni]
MNKSKYTVEDFVLDPEFKRWVIYPDSSSKSDWKNFLENHPDKLMEIKAARKIIINMAVRSRSIPDGRVESIWKKIKIQVDNIDQFDGKVVPISSESIIRSTRPQKRIYERIGYFQRLASILILSIMVAFMAAYFTSTSSNYEAMDLKQVYKEHYAPQGIKSSFTLNDGTKIMLNSNSSIRYIDGFEKEKREIVLIGEAFFDVAEDKSRPFIVNTGKTATKALGTSFNISGYENEDVEISLVSGIVEVNIFDKKNKRLQLIPGEALKYENERQVSSKYSFEKDKVLSWTEKTIYFDQTPINEVVRVLENWYGVNINLMNIPDENYTISGIFKDQSLENVLSGMSYSAKITYQINEKNVQLTFKK